jgi:hypothetical protein
MRNELVLNYIYSLFYLVCCSSKEESELLSKEELREKYKDAFAWWESKSLDKKKRFWILQKIEADRTKFLAELTLQELKGFTLFLLS